MLAALWRWQLHVPAVVATTASNNSLCLCTACLHHCFRKLLQNLHLGTSQASWQSSSNTLHACCLAPYTLHPRTCTRASCSWACTSSPSQLQTASMQCLQCIKPKTRVQELFCFAYLFFLFTAISIPSLYPWWPHQGALPGHLQQFRCVDAILCLR